MGPWAFPAITSTDRARQVEFIVFSIWTDAKKGEIASPISFTIQVSAAITGLAPASKEHTHPAGSKTLSTPYKLNPCTLPGGSDLPGTSITVTTLTVVPPGYQANRNAFPEILGDDTSLPTVQLVSDPSNGAKVKEGDTIELTAIAEETKTGGSWQTGVSKIEISVMKPSGEDLVSESYLEHDGKSCDAKSWKQTTKKFTYTVPEGVKGDLRICAFGYDFAGNIGKKCYTYHTGNQLKGKLTSTHTHSTSAADNISKGVHRVNADLSLNLEPGGTLTGTAQITYSFHKEGTISCGPYSSTIDPMKLTLPVNGEWTKDAIVFRFTTDAPIMAAETMTTCGRTKTPQVNVTFLGGDRHANWDGRAYKADDRTSSSGANWTSEHHWTIHLEPPEPGVG